MRRFIILSLGVACEAGAITQYLGYVQARDAIRRKARNRGRAVGGVECSGLMIGTYEFLQWFGCWGAGWFCG